MVRVLLSLILVLTVSCVGDSLVLPNLRHSEHSSTDVVLDKETLELAGKQILRLLGIPSLPKSRRARAIHVPHQMWNLYEEWIGLKYDSDPETNIIRAVHHESHHQIRNEEDGTHSLLFKLSNVPDTEYVRKAELHVYRAPHTQSSGTANSSIFLHTHSKKLLSSCDTRLGAKHHYETRNLNLSSAGWETFDISDAVRHWIRNPDCNDGLKIKFVDNAVQKRSIKPWLHLNKEASDLDDTEWEMKRPVLVIHTNDGKGKRKRRSLSDISPGEIAHVRNRRNVYSSYQPLANPDQAQKLHEQAKREVCRRRPMYLDFRKVGWNKQIIAPAGFDMYYCGGRCPRPLGPHMNTTNHAVIQNQVNSFEPSIVPPPCCVPTTLIEKSVLLINEYDQVTLKNYEGMIVEGCGCR